MFIVYEYAHLTPSQPGPKMNFQKASMQEWFKHILWREKKGMSSTKWLERKSARQYTHPPSKEKLCKNP